MSESVAVTGIQKAVRAVGSQERLGDLIGVSKQAIQKMVERGYAPTNRVVEIENATGVPRAELIDPKLADLMAAPFSEDE